MTWTIALMIVIFVWLTGFSIFVYLLVKDIKNVILINNREHKVFVKNDKVLSSDMHTVIILQKKINEQISTLFCTLKNINAEMLTVTNANLSNAKKLEEESKTLKKLNTTLALEVEHLNKELKEMIEKQKEAE